jgi:hypothetical protein
MNKKLKQKWVAALRSGKYQQGSSVLKRVDNGETSHCCLGVLCETDGIKSKDTGSNWSKAFVFPNGEESTEYLPSDYADSIGLPYGTMKTLARFNDGYNAGGDHAPKRSFAWIASYIERYL